MRPFPTEERGRSSRDWTPLSPELRFTPYARGSSLGRRRSGVSTPGSETRDLSHNASEISVALERRILELERENAHQRNTMQSLRGMLQDVVRQGGTAQPALPDPSPPPDHKKDDVTFWYRDSWITQYKSLAAANKGVKRNNDGIKWYFLVDESGTRISSGESKALRARTRSWLIELKRKKYKSGLPTSWTHLPLEDLRDFEESVGRTNRVLFLGEGRWKLHQLLMLTLNSLKRKPEDSEVKDEPDDEDNDDDNTVDCDDEPGLSSVAAGKRRAGTSGLPVTKKSRIANPL
ncbi:hypothetical protein EIP86_006763 [Pleurotus ostreatoroseus]|nr:hypothetical protein EIP86_006763 [Pleurotus ostreatoroseus]